MTENKLKNKSSLFNILTILLILVIAAYLCFQLFYKAGIVDISAVKTFNTIFISILMQAFPFMLIGIFVSSALHVFIPDEFIVKLFPLKKGLGFITALFAGLFFPVCECAIVPVVTRLVKKGVALPAAITFLLSAPIINPIVIISTLYAFPGQPEIVVYRLLFGLSIALIIGIVLHLSTEPDKKKVLLTTHEDEQEHHKHSCSCACCEDEQHRHDEEHISIWEKLKNLFLHSSEEFFTVGKYLIIGAFFTSLIQTLVPKEMFLDLGKQNGLSLVIMMATAFLFSACSTSDAFIARSFVNKFSMGAVMGFMVFGPMMDVKNILMLLSGFKKSFVLKLVLLIFAFNFLVLYLFAFFI
jgi:uncharacterized membrane protein YraQ (UPF0718 family)